jgi:molybdopterin converting factor small subunit
VLFFAQARDATGCARASLEGSTVSEVLEAAVGRFGGSLAEVLKISAIWLNGEFASGDEEVADTDEVAVLPPVSGG